MEKMQSNNYLNVKPKLSRYIILRYAEPDPPLIYHREKHQLIKATNYKVLDLLKLCTGKYSILELHDITGIDAENIYKLVLKLKSLGWLFFE